MWKLDCEESWAPKNRCFWTVVLEKTLESPLDCKEIHQSILKDISPGCSLEGMMLMGCIFFSCSHNSPAGLCSKICLICLITLIGLLQFCLHSLFPYWYFPGSTSQIDCLQSKTHFSVNFKVTQTKREPLEQLQWNFISSLLHTLILWQYSKMNNLKILH